MIKISLLLFLFVVVVLQLFPQALRPSILCTCPVQKINGGAALQPVRLTAFWTLDTTHLSLQGPRGIVCDCNEAAHEPDAV